MKKTLIKFWSQHTALTIGAVVSVVLLATFLLFQYNDSIVLKLESRWLLVAGVPLLAALIVGGYIKSFKGFGVELEASLSKPVTNIELTATEAMDDVLGDEKRSINYLHGLSLRERKSISRLVLVQGRIDYYRPHALDTYLHELTGLKYIEIRNQQGQFVALIPISEFKHGAKINNNQLGEFIHVLEQSQVLQRYSKSVITVHITKDTGLIESLKVMRRHRIQQLVVLDENGDFQGLLLARVVEKRIVENVLQAKENA